jgi:hypothetical protein
MTDFWAFRKMITPVIIQAIFWIGSLISIILGIIMIANAHTASVYNIYGSTSSSWNMARVWYGIFLIILGPFFIRIWCEMLILFFRINETLTEIKNNTTK